jgi:hypothetical protein
MRYERNYPPKCRQNWHRANAWLRCALGDGKDRNRHARIELRGTNTDPTQSGWIGSFRTRPNCYLTVRKDLSQVRVVVGSPCDSYLSPEFCLESSGITHRAALEVDLVATGELIPQWSRAWGVMENALGESQ